MHCRILGRNANTYSGTITTIPYTTGSGAGTYVAVNGSMALQNATLNLTNNTGGQRYVGTPLIFNTGLGSATLGGISGSGNIILNGFNENTYAQQPDAIALSVGNSASTTYSGTISGTGSFTKIGTGTQTLSGGNIYTGDTTINGGTLALTGSWVNSTNITVSNGTTLDVSGLGSITMTGYQILFGGGTINGSMNMSSGSKIYAGANGGYGTNIITGSLTLASGASSYFDLSSVASGANDKIILNGAGSVLTCGGTSIGINCGATLDQANDYVLFSLTGASPSIAGNFNPIPVWTGTTPANASAFSLVAVGNAILLHSFHRRDERSGSNEPSRVGYQRATSATLNGRVLL